MPRTRHNPRGLPASGLELVRIGPHGQHSHIWDPVERRPLCGSGKSAGRYPKGASAAQKKEILAARQAASDQNFYPSNAKEVTCYRCAKLAKMNLERSGGSSFLPARRAW
jgi:hypothetical protein